MEFLWSRPEKLEGSDNNGGSTISSCVGQLIGGISDILSLENILEATASILEDDEDESELEEELLLQCGSGKACGVDEDGDKCQSDTQTKDEIADNLQSVISDSTEPVSGHNPTEIKTDKEIADNCVTVQNNQDVKASDNTIAINQPSLTSQECEETTNVHSSQTPSSDASNGTLCEKDEKEDQGLVFDSNAATAKKEEGPAAELVSHEREVSTTSSHIDTLQSAAVNPPAVKVHDQTIDLPQENIVIDATSPPTDKVQEEMVDQSLCSSISQVESEEVSVTTSSVPGGEDVQKSDVCNPCPVNSTTDVPNTEANGESHKAGDLTLSPVHQMMETIVEEDISNVSSDSVLDPIESDPTHTDTDAQLNQISSSESDSDAKLKPDTDTEPEACSPLAGPLSSSPAHSQDQQGAPVSDEPVRGQTVSPYAPALEQGDSEDSRGAPINTEQQQQQQQPVFSTEPDTHSITDPDVHNLTEHPEQEPVDIATAVAELQDQESGDQALASTYLVPVPEPEPTALPPDSLHATPESPLSGLTAQDSAAVGQEVTSMEQKGEEASSADSPSGDALQVNGEEEPRQQQPIAEQHDKPASEESSHQPIAEQLVKPELGEARSDKQEREGESEMKEDSEESGDDAKQENGTPSSSTSQSAEETASPDSQQPRTKYNTVCYRKIKRGNTKQRIDEFESLMNV